MGPEVLLSAMHLENEDYIDSLFIHTDCVVINQCDDNAEKSVSRTGKEGDYNITYVETAQRGLSKSRNMAISKAKGPICILCDNDVEYVSDYDRRINDAFMRHPDADIIVFFVKRPERQTPVFSKEKRMGYLSVLKIFSPEIAFRKESIKGIRFDERFGAGAGYFMGEENLFLYECLRRGLKIVYVPEMIASVRSEESTWFTGFNREFFFARGANYAAMSRIGSFILILQYAIRKKKFYKDELTTAQTIREMLNGRKDYLFPRIFFAGDAVSGTGPANVTRYYTDNLPAGTLCQKFRSKILRLPEIFIKTLLADVVVYSGYSKQNIPGLRLAKRLGRPSAYLMHGCVEYENGINLEDDDVMTAVERKTLELADLIIAVSESFAAWLKEHYSEYADKIDFVYNGIDDALFENASKRDDKERHMIFSIGGGMPRKKIRHICEAVSILRESFDPAMYVCVIGDKGADSDTIDSYDFVEDLGIVPHERAKELFDQACVFVQNSCFETFGLAGVEAIASGCPTLLTRHVGALGIISNANAGDIIENYDDPEEIASKIKELIENPNAKRLAEGLDRESCSWKKRSEVLRAKLSELALKR